MPEVGRGATLLGHLHGVQDGLDLGVVQPWPTIDQGSIEERDRARKPSDLEHGGRFISRLLGRWRGTESVLLHSVLQEDAGLRVLARWVRCFLVSGKAHCFRRPAISLVTWPGRTLSK